jgi:hypothetical protein
LFPPSPTCRSENVPSSFPVVHVGVVECAPASPYTYSSTHRFPDERTPIEATPLSATSAELVLGLGLGLGLGSHSSSHAPSHAPLLFATLLSHNIPFPRVHECVMGRLVHTCLGSSYLIAHVLHCPPSPPAHSFIIGPAVINTHCSVSSFSLTQHFWWRSLLQCADNLAPAHGCSSEPYQLTAYYSNKNTNSLI